MRKTKKMDDVEDYARSYIDAALERLGGKSKISSEDYENAVKRAATVFDDLAYARQRSSEDREPVGPMR